MTDKVKIVGILNELLLVERRNLARRLLEAEVFTPSAASGEARVLERLARSSWAHGAWLEGAISALGGVPGPRLPDASSADLHYQELTRVLPRLIDDHEALIRKYELAAERIPKGSEAEPVVQRVLSSHREGINALQGLTSQ